MAKIEKLLNMLKKLHMDEYIEDAEGNIKEIEDPEFYIEDAVDKDLGRKRELKGIKPLEEMRKKK